MLSARKIFLVFLSLVALTANAESGLGGGFSRRAGVPSDAMERRHPEAQNEPKGDRPLKGGRGVEIKESFCNALQNDVEFLCDSICAGRASRTSGGSEATMYLVRRFREMGYKPFVQGFGKGRNVYVQTPGTAPSGGYIVVMAYYDGLGVQNGSLYPGADSNASGVAALLALAEELKGVRGVIFAAVDAHRANSAGAKALYNKLKGRKIALVMNLDILGGDNPAKYSYWKDFLMVLGGERYKTLAEKANRGVALHLYYDYFGSRTFTELFYRKTGEHKVFMDAGIPTVVLTSGITTRVNSPADTPDTINYPILEKRVKFISNWIRNYGR